MLCICERLTRPASVQRLSSCSLSPPLRFDQRNVKELRLSALLTLQ